MLEIFLLLLIGLIGGFAGGLLGIGGGAIYIPAMVLLLGEDQHLAQGASLAAIIATAGVGSVAHFRRSNIDVHTVLWVAPVAADAACGAALLADTPDPATPTPVADAYASEGGSEIPAGAWRLCEIVAIVAGKMAGGYLVLFNRKVE